MAKGKNSITTTGTTNNIINSLNDPAFLAGSFSFIQPSNTTPNTSFMKVTLRTFFLPLFAIAFCLVSSFAFGQTVTTDKQDYLPGQTVTITGTGWQADEKVMLIIEETGPQNIHGADTLYAIANASGEILNAEYVIQDHDLHQNFTLTAIGLNSNLTAQTTFTDGTITWNGNTSTDWNTASNWTGGIPASGDDVTIPTGLARYPILTTGQTFSIKSITINSGGILTLNTGSTLNPDGAASFINGTINTTGILNFGSKNVSGTGSITISGGTVTLAVEL